MSHVYVESRRPAGHLVWLVPMAMLLSACAGTPAPSGSHAAGAIAAEISDAERRSFEAALADMHEQRWARAHDRLEQLASARPDLPGPRVNLAIVLRELGQEPAAHQLLQQLVQSHPAFAPGHHQLALLLRGRGEFAAADQAYAGALMADADYALAHYNRAVLNDLYLNRPAVALTHFQHYQHINGAEGGEVSRWIMDLQRRVDSGSAQQVADNRGGS